MGGFILNIYISSDKVENLTKEAGIKSNRLPLSLQNIKISGSIKNMSVDVEAKKSENSEITKILSSLKRKGKLVDLKYDSEIRQFSYITSKGVLKYTHSEDGQIAFGLNERELKLRGDINFFDDDKLFFEIKINHNSYDKILIKCMPKNIQVFGTTNWNAYKELEHSVYTRQPNSSDPGILGKSIPIEFVVWVTGLDLKSKSIEGSPINISC